MVARPSATPAWDTSPVQAYARPPCGSASPDRRPGPRAGEDRAHPEQRDRRAPAASRAAKAGSRELRAGHREEDRRNRDRHLMQASPPAARPGPAPRSRPGSRPPAGSAAARSASASRPPRRSRTRAPPRTPRAPGRTKRRYRVSTPPISDAGERSTRAPRAASGSRISAALAVAPPRLACARLNAAVKSRTTTTSATSTTPSVVLASGPSARVSVSSASVTIGELTVSVAANSSATNSSAGSASAARNGSRCGQQDAAAVSTTSTATHLEREDPEDRPIALPQVGDAELGAGQQADQPHRQPLHHRRGPRARRRERSPATDGPSARPATR